MSLTNQAKTQLQKYEKYCGQAFLVNFPAQFGIENIEIYKHEHECEYIYKDWQFGSLLYIQNTSLFSIQIDIWGKFGGLQ